MTGPEAHQASRWKELEKHAHEGYSILYIINHSDKADCSSGKLHPFRFELANLEKRYRNQGRGSRALSLLAIPKVRREEDLTEQQMTMKVQLRSSNFAQALVDAERGSRPPGVNFNFRGEAGAGHRAQHSRLQTRSSAGTALGGSGHGSGER